MVSSLIDRPVEVGMHDMGWFFADGKDFVSISTALQGKPSGVYSSAFVAYLIELYWSKAQS